MATVVTELVNNLKHWGITHVFGIPGKAVVPLIGEVEDQGMRFVLSRHEAGAGYAASGYALRSKTLGVAIGTSGPGGTNLLTAAAQAMAYNLPVLFITGHASMNAVGTAHGQDSGIFGTDLVKMFESVTLFSARVERGELLPAYLSHALQKAMTGARGPVHLSIPYDVYFEEIAPFLLDLPSEATQMVSTYTDQVVDLLNEAKRPVLFLGKGVIASDAYAEVRELAERWGVPVITTPGGKGVFPTTHPLSLGGYGLGGTPAASKYLQDGVDLMLVVGTKLTDMSLAGFTKDMLPEQVVQFDIDPTFAGRSLPVPTLFVQGDAKQNLKRVLSVPAPLEAPKRKLSLVETAATAADSGAVEGEMLSAGDAVRAMRTALPESTLLFGDDGSHTFYAIQNYEIYQSGTFFFDDVFGAMGHAIGFSIGAKLADPNRPIVCLTGDGCVYMHGTEIAMAVQEQIPVIFVVLNNGRLDMVDKGMSRMIGRSIGSTFGESELKVKEFAQAMGAKSVCCHTAAEVEQAVAQALTNNGPTVVEVVVDPHEIPPTLKRTC